MAMENAKHAHGDTGTALLIGHGAAYPCRHERVSRSMSALTLDRISNACTGLWRELFTRAWFLIVQGHKQGD